jgi:hypothetical protein
LQQQQSTEDDLGQRASLVGLAEQAAVKVGADAPDLVYQWLLQLVGQIWQAGTACNSERQLAHSSSKATSFEQ